MAKQVNRTIAKNNEDLQREIQEYIRCEQFDKLEYLHQLDALSEAQKIEICARYLVIEGDTVADVIKLYPDLLDMRDSDNNNILMYLFVEYIHMGPSLEVTSDLIEARLDVLYKNNKNQNVLDCFVFSAKRYEQSSWRATAPMTEQQKQGYVDIIEKAIEKQNSENLQKKILQVSCGNFST